MEKVLNESFSTILSESLMFQKSKELQECESLLDEMIVELHKPIINTKFTTEKIEKVELILQEYFNFDFLSIHIGGLNITDVLRLVDKRTANKVGVGNGLGVSNAFTAKMDIISTVKYLGSMPTDYLRRDRGRVEWSGDIRPISTIYVSNGLLLQKNITGAQVLSVILHEIGHSYYHGTIQSRAITSIFSLVTTMLSMLTILQNTVTRALITVANSNFVTATLFNVMYSVIQSVVGEMYSLLYNGRLTSRATQYLGVLGQLVNIAGGAYKSAKSFLQIARLLEALSTGTYNFKILIAKGVGNFLRMDMLGEEKFADEFAAIHGYGPDLIETLSIMQGTSPWNRDEEGVGLDQILNFVSAITDTLRDEFDPHPDIGGRPVFLLDFYKGQLQKVTNIRERRYIEEQIVKTIKASSIYKVTPKEVKPVQLKNMQTSSTFKLLMTSSVVDGIKELITFNTGSANNLDDKFTDAGK
jgi:hypothetical protein